MQFKDLSTNHLLNVIAVLIILIAGYIVLKLFRQNKELETFIEGAVYSKNVTVIPTTTAKPMTTTAKPMTTTSKPITTTAKPMTTTATNLITTTKQPVKMVTTTFAPLTTPTKYTTTAAAAGTTITALQDQINALTAKIAVLQTNCATKSEVANNLVKGTDYTQKINGKVVSTAKISLN